MGLATQLIGAVRSNNVPNYSDGVDPLLQVNSRGDLSVVQGLAPMAEAVRLGNTWQCCIATANAFTHIAAWPTTRAEIVLHNGEPNLGGRSYVINGVWAANVATSIAAASAYTLLAQIVNPATAPTDNTAQLITSRSGRTGGYTGRAKRAIANTSYAVADRWEVLGSIVTPAASIGSGIFVDVAGGLIVPPGAILCLALMCGTATGTASIGVVWSEQQIALG